MNQLDQLRCHSVIVADSGDVDAIRAFHATDCTTNPSLILSASEQPRYRHILDAVLADNPGDTAENILDALLVAFGRSLVEVVPGRVSTELDARLSFDVAASVARARGLIERYDRKGVDRQRVLVKIAATWEGARAAEVLEREGIHCNMTLVFSEAQALCCADAGATLISPFVGRITDWHRKYRGWDSTTEDDPGIRSVERIFALIRNQGYTTQVMGASFRSTAQVLALAGCDLLTISPALLGELTKSDATVAPRLTNEWAAQQSIEPALLDERKYRWRLNEDAMATEKLAEGIRFFAADTLRLEALLGSIGAR